MTIDDLRDTLNRVQEWTRAVDQKVSTTVLVATAFAALYLPNIPEWFTNSSLSGYRFAIALAAVLWVLSIVASCLALFARTKSTHGPSLTFFGTIAGQSLDAYRESCAVATADSLYEDFIQQIHACSEICERKHFWSKFSLLTFFASLGVLLLAYLHRSWSL